MAIMLFMCSLIVRAIKIVSSNFTPRRDINHVILDCLVVIERESQQVSGKKKVSRDDTSFFMSVSNYLSVQVDNLVFVLRDSRVKRTKKHKMIEELFGHGR